MLTGENIQINKEIHKCTHIYNAPRKYYTKHLPAFCKKCNARPFLLLLSLIQQEQSASNCRLHWRVHNYRLHTSYTNALQEALSGRYSEYVCSLRLSKHCKIVNTVTMQWDWGGEGGVGHIARWASASQSASSCREFPQQKVDDSAINHVQV